MTLLLANPQQVMVAWLKGLPFIGTGMAGIEPIVDNNSWPVSGYVQVEGTIGGQINQYTGQRQSVVQLDVMAYSPSSPWPLFGTSRELCERLIAAGIDNLNTQSELTLLPNMQKAIVFAVQCTEPFQVPGDENYARFTMDTRIDWVGL